MIIQQTANVLNSINTALANQLINEEIPRAIDQLAQETLHAHQINHARDNISTASANKRLQLGIKSMLPSFAPISVFAQDPLSILNPINNNRTFPPFFTPFEEIDLGRCNTPESIPTQELKNLEMQLKEAIINLDYRKLADCIEHLKKSNININSITSQEDNLLFLALTSIIQDPESWNSHFYNDWTSNAPCPLSEVTPAKEIIRLLIKAGVDQNYVDASGNTALHLVFNKNSVGQKMPSSLISSIVFDLMYANENSKQILNTQDKIDGMTPAHLAAQAKEYGNLIALGHFGANLEIRDGQNKNVYDYLPPEEQSHVQSLFQPNVD